ncbi:MAG: HAD hydrolase family protein [Bacteroidales bacterium]|nr:HAD hydrolase family protein [Bacteroidales bacterium]
MSSYKSLLHKIKAFAFDVDGVFTDGLVLLFPGNEFVRAVNIKDGYAVQHAVKLGYPIAIISGGRSEEVAERFRRLGVTDIYLGASYKLDFYEDFRMKYGFEHEEILYMGDDMPDYEIMQRVGIPTAPKDACTEIKELARYVSDRRGGEGCVRDVIEQVMRVHDNWMVDQSVEW